MSYYDSILFDLDGTLWDATAVTADIWDVVALRHPEMDIKIDHTTIRKYMGHTNEELASLLFPELPFEQGYNLIMESCREENHLLREYGGKLYPYVSEVLCKLARQYPLFIISNCQSGYIDTFLSYHGFYDKITDHISSGDTALTKAENIQYICRKHSLKQPVYIGDTMGDYLAADSVGCPFIYASYGFGQTPPEHCTATIHSLHDLLTILR